MSFTFKQFHINDEHCAMKVGTDGVLLGAWADVEKATHILDIGCGSGLIALMLAQRARQAKVVGIEIDAQAAADAKTNVERSQFSKNIDIVVGDALHYGGENHFDCVVSNPPYHEEELLPPTIQRAKARHTTGGGLTFTALLETASKLLKKVPQATFAVVLPPLAVSRFVTLATIYGFHLCRRTNVVTRINKPCKRVLLEFSWHQTTLVADTLILLDDEGKRSEAYNALCADFYL